MKKFLLCTIAALMMSVQAFAGDITVYSNGNEVADKGVIIDNRTMVPVRGVFEYMGYDVEWDSATKSATIYNSANTIILTNGQATFNINGKDVTPEVPQQIIDGRFMLPLRAVGEALGEPVNWDSATKTAYIGTDSTINTKDPDTTSDENAEDNPFELIDNGDGTFTIPGISIKMLDPEEAAQQEDGFTDLIIE